MANYIGVRCPVCNKKFTEADDIVVCPVCGAPHHRDCYKQSNQCAFSDDHISGKTWSDPAAQIPPTPEDPAGDRAQAEGKACANCGTKNSPDTIFCQTCGQPMNRPQTEGAHRPQGWVPPLQINTISMAYGGLDPEETIAGEKVRDIAQYVGSGSAYYLPRFHLLHQRKRAVSISLSALVFNFMYYFYRKMYLMGAFLLLINLLGNIPAYLYSWEILPQVLENAQLGTTALHLSATAEHLYWLAGITRPITFIISLLVSLYANKYYFKRVIAAVHKIRTTSEQAGDPPQQYGQKLERAGGCNKALIIALVVLFFVLVFAASSVLTYQFLLPQG